MSTDLDLTADPVELTAALVDIESESRNESAIADAVERDRSDARQLGITHVPSFLVNDELLIGAQSLDTLRRVIDAAAVKAP